MQSSVQLNRMAVLDLVAEQVRSPNLRPLDIRKDLLRVADLIELCFAGTMDEDGREYLRQMRQAARDAHFLGWAPEAAERVAMPLSGFVWEEGGQLIGNLSLIPMSRQGRRVYLIANVAVHPDYRRRGIARALTQTALEYLEKKQVGSAWLQVREDNPAAHHLYLSLGFIERARRAAWEATPRPRRLASQLPGGLQITSRQPGDWPYQKVWLVDNYPPEVDWNLNFRVSDFKPGFWVDLLHFLDGNAPRHWAIRRSGRLAALLTWQSTRTFADNLWLAAPYSLDSDTIFRLLSHALYDLPDKRAVSVNYPSGISEDAFIAAGFTNRQTLIWMEARLANQS